MNLLRLFAMLAFLFAGSAFAEGDVGGVSHDDIECNGHYPCFIVDGAVDDKDF
ncbi:hypothetical protein [Marinobacter sp. X15-166B]|uniref:hypothetical protein n=1 Tax=Marinobacter sp. X15-166B TaxID=1897620 RepID=UPI0013019003|nr:hypothetical protein [Marinobacter sp. X15-166B]